MTVSRSQSALIMGSLHDSTSKKSSDATKAQSLRQRASWVKQTYEEIRSGTAKKSKKRVKGAYDNVNNGSSRSIRGDSSSLQQKVLTHRETAMPAAMTRGFFFFFVCFVHSARCSISDCFSCLSKSFTHTKKKKRMELWRLCRQSLKKKGDLSVFLPTSSDIAEMPKSGCCCFFFYLDYVLLCNMV